MAVANAALASMDNGHSLAGLYGLANPVVSWLIHRGQGELVALTPDELRQGAKAPNCPGSHNRPWPMCWRGGEWVCYEHDTPIRKRIPPHLQKLPSFPGGLSALLAVADKTVEIKYRSEDGRRAAWHYYVDGELVDA